MNAANRRNNTRSESVRSACDQSTDERTGKHPPYGAFFTLVTGRGAEFRRKR